MALQKGGLLEKFVDSVRAGGGSVLIVNATHPFELVVRSRGEDYFVRLYIWNVTHGGGSERSPSEYRIQITGIANVDAPPAGQALLMGWDPVDRVFVAFDPARHRAPIAASPSIQVSRETLNAGRVTGLASQVRGNRETAVAFRPDFLPEYVAQQRNLHAVGENPEAFATLVAAARAAPATEPEPPVLPPDPERRRILRQVSQAVRAHDFRERVLGAYANRCGVCGIALQLLQAAHIVPVGHTGGTDETSNGIAMCSLHHDAYDRGLIAVSGSYDVLMNKTLLEAHRKAGHSHGEADFIAALTGKLRLPATKNDWPDPDNLIRAMAIRGW